MNAVDLAALHTASPTPPSATAAKNPALRKAFDSFVGETLFGQMLRTMRKSIDKNPYFDGGQAEEIFTQQLDQALVTKLSAASADKLSGPMYQLFTLQRK
jgi:hypothetical protein